MSGWQTVLIAIGGQAALLVVLGFLARSLVSNWLAKDLERHKDALRHESERSLEALRHQLAMVAQENAVKTAELQSRRAQVIANIYAMLSDVEWEGSEFVGLVDHTMKGQAKGTVKFAEVSAKVEQFYRYFNGHRIYLPEDTCESIWLVMNGMVQATNTLKAGMIDRPPADRLDENHLEALIEATNYFKEHHPAARKKLERDLRAMMGDLPSK